MKKLYRGLTSKDKIQIILNLAAFAVLITSTGGKGSFWAFLSFTALSGINLIEVTLSKDSSSGKWVWITKTTTYAILTYLLIDNRGDPKQIYFWMIAISAIALIISKSLIRKRAIALSGACFANLFGAGMYALAVINNSESYGLIEIVFWLLNLASYVYWHWEVWYYRKDRVNYIITIYATVVCLMHIILIAIT